MSGTLPDQFDNSSGVADSRRLRRRGQLVVLPIAIGFVVLAVLYLTLFPLGAPSPTVDQRIVPYLIIGIGAPLLAIGLFARGVTVTTATVSDHGIRVSFSNGKTVEQRWADPMLHVRLTRATRTMRWEPQLTAVLLSWRGFDSSFVSREIADGIVARARRLGLEVGTEKREVPPGGPPSARETTTISHGEGRPSSG